MLGPRKCVTRRMLIFFVSIVAYSGLGQSTNRRLAALCILAHRGLLASHVSGSVAGSVFVSKPSIVKYDACCPLNYKNLSLPN